MRYLRAAPSRLAGIFTKDRVDNDELPDADCANRADDANQPVPWS